MMGLFSFIIRYFQLNQQKKYLHGEMCKRESNMQT